VHPTSNNTTLAPTPFFRADPLLLAHLRPVLRALLQTTLDWCANAG
jgi:hypothetical protein